MLETHTTTQSPHHHHDQMLLQDIQQAKQAQAHARRESQPLLACSACFFTTIDFHSARPRNASAASQPGMPAEAPVPQTVGGTDHSTPRAMLQTSSTHDDSLDPLRDSNTRTHAQVHVLIGCEENDVGRRERERRVCESERESSGKTSSSSARAETTSTGVVGQV